MVKTEATECNGRCVCIAVCSVDSVRLTQGKAVANEQCLECESCISFCPTQAISPHEN